jgi:hypothetical protein
MSSHNFALVGRYIYIYIYICMYIYIYIGAATKNLEEGVVPEADGLTV